MATRERIEEFRRKLREGQAVRVSGGQVMLADEPDEPSQAALVANQGQQLAMRPAQGVQVKPHTWGSDFLFTAEGQRRAMLEQTLLAGHYPDFVMDVEDDGTPFAHGHIGPNARLKGRYHVLIILPPGYGQGLMPQVHILEPRLRSGAPHTFVDGSLCLDHSGAFTRRSTLVTLMAWVAVWLVLYEGWLQTGEVW